MKLPSYIWQKTTDRLKNGASRQSSIANRQSREGVALIITLIMLSVITFMAVTFLVLSQRERNSVTIATDQKIARDASDTALARVSAELLTHMLLNTNFQDFNLMVSTNYINSAGLFDGTPGTLNPTNVNYDYLVGTHAPITTLQDRNINIASLSINPRAPVFITTNSGLGSNEFRFYIDMNRNGHPDTNGMSAVISPFPATPFYNATNGVPVAAGTGAPILSNNFVGDPEWIGILERPAELHSADNKFIARYAYLVVPVGKTLDINTIHNQAATKTVNPAAGANDGFLRNQGVGPWEINLAAFLVDLNTNLWDADPTTPQLYYQYNEDSAIFPGPPNHGVAFDDARAILSYRYANSYGTMASANILFPNAAARLASDNIDTYSDGPIMFGTSTNEGLLPDITGFSWAGADNTNHYFTTQDLFDKSKTGAATPGFSDRLQQVGGSNDSYNAYTFYRMLSQLGTDSQPDPNKININYKNTDTNGNIVPGMETNLFAWSPVDFFTNAANAMFKQLNLRDLNGNLITVTNIPIYEDPARYNGTNINYYTPAVHRILQLAANIYDATTNQTVPLVAGQTNAYYPSVFRPYFRSQSGVVSIAGFVEESNTAALGMPFLVPAAFATVNQLNTGVNLSGVPWVIGAKKGFPNFNYYAVKPQLQLTRKLQLSRAHTGDKLTIKQMFNLSITNQVAVEAWNSYLSAWPMATRQLQLFVTNDFTVRVINSTNVPIDLLVPFDAREFTSVFLTNQWPGYNASFPSRSGILPVNTNYSIMGGVGPTYSYHAGIPQFQPGTNYEPTTVFTPQWYIVTTNRFRFAMVDQAANRVVDFVNLDDSGEIFDLTRAITNNVDCVNQYNANTVWCSQPVAGTPFRPLTDLAGGTVLSKGLDAQIMTSLGEETFWAPSNSEFFQFVMDPANPAGTNETGYNPTFATNLTACWQANDPLVHYTVGDLTDPQQNPLKVVFPPIMPNHHYQPWNHNSDNSSDSDNPIVSLAKKDPLVTGSDSWDFLTNRLWNVGLLGRVHRGTPWQTIYMKSPLISLKDWTLWTGDTSIYTNGNSATADAAFTVPTADYRVFDLFTTGMNENASRGQLNINQTNLAAWSAVLSGVNVLTNSRAGAIGPAVIQPAGVYDPANPPPVIQILQGINAARANTNPTNQIVFPNQTFQHLGDVLSAPQLTVASPFLITSNLISGSSGGLSDEIVERIPQQIMSLLSLSQTPRFVIYSFGQTLHPADHSLVSGGTFNGLCTNYQITAETATRAVVRVEGSLDSNATNYPPHIVIEQFNPLAP